MSETLYIDTNVVIDAVQGRQNLFGKNIGNPAADLFSAAISCKYKLMISDWCLQELDGVIKLESAKMFFALVKHKILGATYTTEEKAQAKNEAPTNWRDKLHALIAERENTDKLVTRNVDDFKEFNLSMPVVKPEKLL